MRKEIFKYNGFSLVEMLLTIMILSVVMLLVATTLNTVIKASNTANSKNLARSDINYIMEVYNRSLSNAELEDIYLYSVSDNARIFTVESGLPKIKSLDSTAVSNAYENELISLRDPTGYVGSEVHVKVYGYSVWTCLGFFKDVNGYGYIVKATNTTLTNHSECFNDNSVITMLNSFSIDVKDFNIQYVDIGDNRNSMFIVNSTVVPLFWPVGDSFPVTRDVSRQIVVSTEALTWY